MITLQSFFEFNPRVGRSIGEILIAGVAILLSACSLPPETQWNQEKTHPTADVKTVSAPTSEVYRSSAGAAPVSLESLARDGKLPFRPCLEQSLKHNLKVQIAHLSSAAASKNEAVAAAAFDPVIRLNGVTYPDVGNGWDSKTGSALVKKKFITGGELRAEVGDAFTNNTDRGLDYHPGGTEHVVRFTQPLLRGAGVAVNRAPIDMARILTSSSSAMARAEVMEMLRATETAYWTAVWAKEALRVQNESLARSRQILADVEEKHRLGAATKIDQLEAQSALAAANEQVERASQKYSDAVANLCYLLGLMQESEPTQLVFESLRPVGSEKLDAEGHFSHALKNNPQEVLLANEVERASVENRVAKNALLPSVDLEISHGSAGLIGFTGQTSNGKTNDNANWSAFLQVTIPWTSRAERAQAEKAQLQLERSELAREDGRRQLRRDIFETVRDIQSGRRQYEAASEGVRVNQAKWGEQVHRHKEGLVTVRELREAEAELQQASLRELTAQLGVLVADARLARLDGSVLERHALVF